MQYKKYELVKSITNIKTGETIWIARNQLGGVAFRAESLNEIKKMIDRMEREEKKRLLKIQQLAEKRKKEKAKIAKTKKITPTSQKITPASTPVKPLRGPDGKFVSQKTPTQQTTDDKKGKKKSFWDKLVG